VLACPRFARAGRCIIGGVTTLYRAGSQLTKVRAVMLLSLAGAALSIWWGIDLAQTYGLNPGDGAVLRPVTQRLLAGATVAGLGVAFAIGMWVYGRCYAARIDFDAATQQLRLHTVRFLGTRRQVIDVGDIGEARWHHGQFQLHISVNAPWVSVRMAGRRLPLLIDAQGVVSDRRLMKKYFGWSGGVAK
jgi:hypothetical protein